MTSLSYPFLADAYRIFADSCYKWKSAKNGRFDHGFPDWYWFASALLVPTAHIGVLYNWENSLGMHALTRKANTFLISSDKYLAFESNTSNATGTNEIGPLQKKIIQVALQQPYVRHAHSDKLGMYQKQGSGHFPPSARRLNLPSSSTGSGCGYLLVTLC